MIFSSECENKRLQCYDRWKKLFRSAVKNNLRTIDNIQILYNWFCARFFLFQKIL